MGFRFRRSFGVLPGVRINMGRRGPSVSLGVRGAHMTVGPTGVRNTVGIPRTGMSYTTTHGWGQRAPNDAPVSPPPVVQPVTTTGVLGWTVAAILLIVLVSVLLSR